MRIILIIYLCINYNTITNYILIIYELRNLGHTLGVVSQTRVSGGNRIHDPHVNSLEHYSLDYQGTRVLYYCMYVLYYYMRRNARVYCVYFLWELINLSWKTFSKNLSFGVNVKPTVSRIKLKHTTWLVWEARMLYNGSIRPAGTVLNWEAYVL